MWNPDPPGRITPGGVLAVLGVAGLVWYVLQPQDQRAALLCAPVSHLVQWIIADDAPENLWTQKITAVMARFSQRCPESLGTPAATLAERVRTSGSQALSRARAATHRQIEEATAPDRLRIAGLGEARLLGITVPEGQAAASLAYLRTAVAGKRLAVTVLAARDPEKRPLVVVTLEDGTLVNARLIQQGLARPWRIPGSWQGWATGPSPAGAPAARAAPGN